MTLAPLWTVVSIAKLFWQISTLIRQLLEAGLARIIGKEGKRASPFNFETTFGPIMYFVVSICKLFWQISNLITKQLSLPQKYIVLANNRKGKEGECEKDVH